MDTNKSRELRIADLFAASPGDYAELVDSGGVGKPAVDQSEFGNVADRLNALRENDPETRPDAIEIERVAATIGLPSRCQAVWDSDPADITNLAALAEEGASPPALDGHELRSAAWFALKRLERGEGINPQDVDVRRLVGAFKLLHARSSGSLGISSDLADQFEAIVATKPKFSERVTAGDVKRAWGSLLPAED